MDHKVTEQYEFKEIFRILDAIQVYTDNNIFSQQSPAGRDTDSTTRKTNIKILEKMFHPNPINNNSIHLILDRIHENYVSASKEILRHY